MKLTRAEVNAIPEHWISYLSHFLIGLNATDVDYRKPHIRPALIRIYPFIVATYALLIVFGTLANLAVIVHICRRRLHHDVTYCLFINIALCNMVKCSCVLPITLAVMLIQNWVFGQFLCFFLPMMQDIPIHVSVLTYLLIAIDRFRLLQDPLKPRLPSFVCAMGTWLLAICIVLPYPIYITYIDLGLYAKTHLEGVGICAFNLMDDVQEYTRPLFLIMYVAPLGSITYFYIRMSRELQAQEGPMAVMMVEPRNRDLLSSRSHTTSHSITDYDDVMYENHLNRNSFRSSRDHGYQPSRHVICDVELNVVKEKRTQKYLIAMMTVFAICLTPLMLLRLARLAIVETYENSAHFDLIYTFIVWVAFLPTCTTPTFFILWQMKRATKERFCNYFRLSQSKLEHSCEVVPAAANDGFVLPNYTESTTTVTTTLSMSRTNDNRRDCEKCRRSSRKCLEHYPEFHQSNYKRRYNDVDAESLNYDESP